MACCTPWGRKDSDMTERLNCLRSACRTGNIAVATLGKHNQSQIIFQVLYIYSLILFFNLFIWLHWVLVAACQILVAVCEI